MKKLLLVITMLIVFSCNVGNCFGMSLIDIKWSDTPEQIKDKLIEQGKTTISRANLITKDGSLVLFEYAASGIFDDDENLKYIVAVGRNVTKRKITEER